MSSPPFLNLVRQAIRVRHYSLRTEKAYVQWAKQFILLHNKKHPENMVEPEVEKFLTYLACSRHVSASTQNQALNALVFVYKNVLQRPLGQIVNVVRARKSRKLPVVLTRSEIKRVFVHLNSDHWLMANLLYGSGLRLMECLRLRIKDIDFEQNMISIRSGKGNKDRVTLLPACLAEQLKTQLAKVRALHERELAEGFGGVNLPYALSKKYPKANREWGCQ